MCLLFVQLDLFLCRYVYQYWRLLKSCSQEELAQLRAPQQQQQQFQVGAGWLKEGALAHEHDHLRPVHACIYWLVEAAFHVLQ